MRAVIFANGLLDDPAVAAAALRPDDWLIAADGGAVHAQRLGVTPQLLVGDLDSLPPGERERLEALGCRLRLFPVRKDATDLELALREAITRASEVLVLGALGARYDQSLANILLLALPELRGHDVRLLAGASELRLAPARLRGRAGDTVSLVPLAGDAHGVTTRGLEYPLERGTLPFGSTLGISNVMLGAEAEVQVAEGLVLIVHTKGGV